MGTDKQDNKPPDKNLPEKRTEAFGEYGTEYEFKLIARMLSRGLPYDMIARTVEIPIQEVVRRATIIRETPDMLIQGDLLLGLGDSEAASAYINQEIMASLLQLSAASGTPPATKVMALARVDEMNKGSRKSRTEFNLSNLAKSNIKF